MQAWFAKPGDDQRRHGNTQGNKARLEQDAEFKCHVCLARNAGVPPASSIETPLAKELAEDVMRFECVEWVTQSCVTVIPHDPSLQSTGVRGIRHFNASGHLSLEGHDRRDLNFLFDLAFTVGHAPIGAIDLEFGFQFDGVVGNADLDRDFDFD